MSERVRTAARPPGAWRTWSETFTSPRYPQCQDAATAITGDGWVVLAVSDGAGSAANAAQGSQSAVSIVQDYVRAHPPVHPDGSAMEPAAQWMRRLVRSVGREWMNCARAQGSVEDFCATLAVVLIAEVSVEIASVGDSFVLGLGSTQKVELILAPDRPSGLTGSSSYMLPDWDEETHYLTVLDPQMKAVLLSTDGLESFLDARVVSRDGQLSATFIGVKPWLANVVQRLSTKGDPTSAAVFGRQDVLALKGDDVGVALALRTSP